MSYVRTILLLQFFIGASLVFAAEQPPTPSAPKKVLVVYFTRTGNTSVIAEQIHASVKSDLFRIEVQNPYPDDYEETKTRATREQGSGFKPLLKTKIGNIASYDVIFIGYPIWWAKLPPPIVSFSSEYDLSGKTIIPFCTHAGSGLGGTVAELERLHPRSTFLDGLAVWGRDAKTSHDEVAEWLGRIRIKEGDARE